MKFIRYLSLVFAFGGVVFVSSAATTDSHKPADTGQLVPVTDNDAAWVAKAKAEYPTSMCVVSGEELGGEAMGKSADFIYREAGKPDRLVSFCCEDCVKDFSKDPEKYLKVLDDAAAPKKTGAHDGHHH